LLKFIVVGISQIACQFLKPDKKSYKNNLKRHFDATDELLVFFDIFEEPNKF